jgi:predicted transcriptional regulator of viral defense system
MAVDQKTYKKQAAVFQKEGGVLRTTDAIRAGISPRDLYSMRDEGVVDSLSRGIYRLASMPPLSNPDLVSVSLRAPNGVICLISALAFHELTTQIPHEVYVAIDRFTRPPRVDYPPMRVFKFSGEAFTDGVEIHRIDGYKAKIYSPEKTVADCFKFRNKIGSDTAIEALKFYCKRKRKDNDALMRYARICRVDKTISPYMEALL